jgi:ribosomal-protein-alanine N-acetyltransferase
MPPTGRDIAEAPVLESERLRLRPLIKADLPAVLVLAGDRQVAEQTARIPHPLTLAAAEAWLESAFAGTNGPKEMLFAIERKEDGAFLGAVGLGAGAGQEPAELGFWLGRPYWNRGYMTEAVRRLLRYAFQQREVPAVRACVFHGNVASVRVQEKIGMRLVGRDIQRAPARGCCGRESEVRELRREDWRP